MDFAFFAKKQKKQKKQNTSLEVHEMCIPFNIMMCLQCSKMKVGWLNINFIFRQQDF